MLFSWYIEQSVLPIRFYIRKHGHISPQMVFLEAVLPMWSFILYINTHTGFLLFP